MRKIRWLNAILAAFAMFFVLGLCSCSQLFEDLGGGLGGLGGSKGGEAPAKVAWLDYDFDRDNLEWERSEAPRARYRIEIDGVEIQDPDTHYGTEKISFDYAATGDFTATVWVENEYGVSEKLTQSFRCLKPIEPMLDKATERLFWEATPRATGYHVLDRDTKEEWMQTECSIDVSYLGNYQGVNYDITPYADGDDGYKTKTVYAFAGRAYGVQNVKCRGGYFSWTHVINGNATFVVTVGDETYETQTTNFSYLPTVDCDVSISAYYADEPLVMPSHPFTARYTAVSEIDDFALSDGSLTWTADAEIALNSYSVEYYQNGEKYGNTETVSVAEKGAAVSLTLPENVTGDYQVSVKPFPKEGFYYGVAQRINVHKLGYVGSSVDGDGAISFFTSDPYIASFKIQVEGVAEHEVTVENVEGEATYDGFAFETSGDYDVIITAVPKLTEGVFFDTRGVGRTIMVTRNRKPTSAEMTEDGILISGLTVKNDSSYVAYELDGGKRFVGETVKGNYGQLFKYTYPENDSTADREHVLKLYNAGSSFGGKHLTSLEAVEVRFTVLGKVSQVSLAEETLTWDYDGAAENFCVYASKENSFNGTEKTAVTVSGKLYEPNGGTGADLTFKVFAKGDVTKNTVSGKPVQSSKFSFLKAPAFERAEWLGESLKLFWNSDNETAAQSGYILNLPDGGTVTATDGFYLFDKDMVGSFSVRAYGDGVNYLRSVDGVEKTLAALKSPTVSFAPEGKKISWSVGAGIDYVAAVYDLATESAALNGADGATEITVDGLEAGEYYFEIYADGETNSAGDTLYYSTAAARTDFVYFTFDLIPQRYGYKVDFQPTEFSDESWLEVYENFCLSYALNNKTYGDRVYSDEFSQFMPAFSADDAQPYWGNKRTFAASLDFLGYDDFWTALQENSAFVDKTEWEQKLRIRATENENRTVEYAWDRLENTMTVTVAETSGSYNNDTGDWSRLAYACEQREIGISTRLLQRYYSNGNREAFTFTPQPYNRTVAFYAYIPTQFSADFSECFLKSEYATCVEGASASDPTAYTQKIYEPPAIGEIKFSLAASETEGAVDMTVEPISYAFLAPDQDCALRVDFWLERRKPNADGYYAPIKVGGLSASIFANTFARGSVEGGTVTFQTDDWDRLRVYVYLSANNADSGALKQSYRIVKTSSGYSYA